MVVTGFELPESPPTPQDDLGRGYRAYITQINLLGLGGVFSSLPAGGNLGIATEIACGAWMGSLGSQLWENLREIGMD